MTDLRVDLMNDPMRYADLTMPEIADLYGMGYQEVNNVLCCLRKKGVSAAYKRQKYGRKDLLLTKADYLRRLSQGRVGRDEAEARRYGVVRQTIRNWRKSAGVALEPSTAPDIIRRSEVLEALNDANASGAFASYEDYSALFSAVERMKWK